MRLMGILNLMLLAILNFLTTVQNDWKNKKEFELALIFMSFFILAN